MIESIYFWSLVFFCFIYIAIHSFLWKGIQKLSRSHFQQKQEAISIIVAARNEEERIGSLMESLINQDYPSDKFEIIIVNDRSTDSTATIIEQFAKHHSTITLISIESNTSDMPHKKNALRLGIEHASFEILAFTDADCIVPKQWLKEISNHYSDDVGVVAGYSPYAVESTSSYLRYEENKNSLIAASAVGLNIAYMCTGRNFSYRKSIYNDVGGFEKIKSSISGDDDLFLQLVQKNTQWNIRYMISPESYVRTFSPKSFSQFVNQRTRHVSASKYYPPHITAGYSAVHLFHLFIAGGFFITPVISIVALMIKYNIDALYIAKGKDCFHETFSIIEFVISETLLVLYSFVLAPLGFIRTFDWKGTSNQ